MINSTTSHQYNNLLTAIVMILTVAFSAWAYVNLSPAASFGILSIGVMIILIVYKIKLLFLTIFLLKPVIDLSWDANLLNLGGLSINLLKIIGIFVPAVCLIQLIISPQTIKLTKLNFFIFLFLIINALSTLTVILESNDILSGLIRDTNYLFKLSNGLLLFITLPYVFDLKTEYLNIVRIIFFSTFTPTIISISQLILNTYNVTIGQGVARFAGIYHDAGGLSLNAFIGIVVSLLYLRILGKYQYKRKVHILHYTLAFFVFAINLAMLYWSLTRMMYIVTFIFIMSWLFIIHRIRWSLLLLIPLIIFYVWSDDSFRQRNWKEIRAYEEYQRGGDYQKYTRTAGGGRLDRWESIINQIDKMSFSEWIIGTGNGSAAHNEYLDTFLRTGFIGLMCFLVATGLLFVFLLGKAQKMISHFEIHAISIFSILLIISIWVMSITGYTITQTTLGIVVWSMISIAVYVQPDKQTTT